MKKLTIFIALAFSVYSCKKNEVIPKQNETTVSIAQTTELNEPWEEAENSSNPYDNRGYHHNLLLNAVFADTPTNPSASDIYYLATDYVDKEFNEDITGIVSYNLYSSLYSDLNNSLYSPYNWIENSSASSSVKTALFDLVDIMTDTTIFETENFEYATIKNGIVKWEEEVMGNENFDSTERVNLLTASSIARYSLLYWWEMDEQLQNNNSFQSNSLFGRRFLRILGWALVGAADAIGGFIGASICTCSLAADIAAGVGLGGAASAAGFFIFRGRGWEP